MKSSDIIAKDTRDFLKGGGEMGDRIRNFDWSNSPLGPVDTWPKSLRTCVQIMLTSRQPIWIGWGNDLIKLYNDPYKQIVKGKHAWALGKPASVVWQEIWQDIKPMLRKVMHEDEGTYVEAQLLIMERNGYPEETYYTFSYTPVAGDNGITEGMICFNTDDTERIIGERQLKTLTQLGKSLTDTRTESEVFTRTINIINENQQDFPFVILYRTNGNFAVMEHWSELDKISAGFPEKINFQSVDEISRLCFKASITHQPQVFESLTEKVGVMPRGAWSVPPDKALILPILQHGKKDSYGFFVVGLNPFRLLDEKYIGFLNLVADQIGMSLANVNAMEEERKRLEALAEIDRAKTIFFSNISHEFRTPLTLLLGPIEDILLDKSITSTNREKAEVAMRNAFRMQKLVNLLLDFSRIEAGKMEAHFEPVDIVSVTGDLCSTFRAAIEKAGMKLIFTNEEIREPVFLDVDMWEKIILNLLSNAFKYTFEGAINVDIRKADKYIQVSVSDSGIGIGENELDKIFERFHRVHNEQGRSQEGTGIGLAMVKELIKLHNGTITVGSKVGMGSTFTVSIPANQQQNNLPADTQTRKRKTPSSVYVNEAAKWLRDDLHEASAKNGNGSQKKKGNRPVILVADDNSDMRLYMERILSADYEVFLAHDGEEAFSKVIENKPDLILSDIMMPVLDGFGLLRKLKSNLVTRHIPLIFLSARAGEEAMVEGIRAGADDYLTKPFSSKELLARISNHIAIARIRRHTELEFYNLFRQSPAHIHIIKGPDYVLEFFHPLAIPYFGQDLTGQRIKDIAALNTGPYIEILDRVFYKGETINLNESRLVVSTAEGGTANFYFNITHLPYRDHEGKIVGVLQFGYDITEQVCAKQKLSESEERLRIAAEISELGTWEYDPVKDEIYCSEKTMEHFGFRPGEKIALRDAVNCIVREDKKKVIQSVRDAFNPNGDHKYISEFSLVNRMDKRCRTLRSIGKVFFNEQRKPIRFIGTAVDITEIKRAEKDIKEREKRFRLLATTIHQIAWIADKDGKLEYLNDQWEVFTGSKASEAMNNVREFIHPDDYDSTMKRWEERMRAGEPWEHEYRLKNIQTQTYRWFLGKVVPLRDESGKIIKWIGSASDIQYLKEQSSWLEQQIQDRTRALKELNLSLKLSNEDLQQFAHVASHDLREPVRKIKIYASKLIEEFDESLPEKGHIYIDKINGATSRMSTMIDGVLSYSTYAAIDQFFEPIDLNGVIRDILSDLEIPIDEKKAVIKYNDLPGINGAPVLIYQLFYNLINNSLKFSRDGVVPIIEITGRLTKHEGKLFARIVLSDNGIGFEEQHSENIFTTFTRLNSKDKFEGTGLGLSLCKKIIQKHGGIISASAIPGVGATFTVRLPVE